MTNELDINYRGARLQVRVSPDQQGELKINGLTREQQKGAQLLLTSTVQTDYEWHEFIEARITFEPVAARVVIIANNHVLAEESLPLKEET